MKLTFKPDLKYKMTADELANYLHLKRKGHTLTKNDKRYTRKQKHKAINY